jgi:hypothetical protein
MRWVCALALGTLAVSAASAQTPSNAPSRPELLPFSEVTAGPAVIAAINPAQLAWAKKPGKNGVAGEAFLRTRGGDVRTCAGLAAELWPVSEYTNTYLSSAIVGDPALMEVAEADRLRKAVLHEVFDYVRTTTCNSQGNFVFSDVPDGAYVVTARVIWEVPSLRRQGPTMNLQGGVVTKAVRLSGGRTVSLTLTH